MRTQTIEGYETWRGFGILWYRCRNIRAGGSNIDERIVALSVRAYSI